MQHPMILQFLRRIIARLSQTRCEALLQSEFRRTECSRIPLREELQWGERMGSEMAVDPRQCIFDGPGLSDPAHAPELPDCIQSDPSVSGDGGLESEIAVAQ